jgi:hypothetical protein
MLAYSHIKVCISLQQFKLLREVISLFDFDYFTQMCAHTAPLHFTQMCAHTAPLHFTQMCAHTAPLHFTQMCAHTAPLHFTQMCARTAPLHFTLEFLYILHDYCKSYMERCMMICLSFFSFGHCIGCPSSIYGFWLPLWYLQAFLHHFRIKLFANMLLCTVYNVDNTFVIHNLNIAR